MTDGIKRLRWPAVGALLLLLVGCPAGGEGDAESPAAAQHGGQAAGGDWIKPSGQQYYLNDIIEVEYRLEQNDPSSPAWIAMVPADTESRLAGDNFALQVEYTHIYELPEGKVNFHARANGEYILRLFGAKRDDSPLAAQSEILRVGDPDGSERQLTPPYITLSGVELPEEIVLRPGMVIAAYWMLQEPLGAEAWLGLVPLSCTSLDAAVNRDAALQIKQLGGKTMGASRFSLKEPGEFVVRLFPSAAAGEAMVCQSEEFSVRAFLPAGE